MSVNVATEVSASAEAADEQRPPLQLADAEPAAALLVARHCSGSPPLPSAPSAALPVKEDWLVAASPVAYGWVVLALTTYARLLKSFGQNNTIWVCVPGLLADNGLSRTRLGTIFSFACIAAAGVQPRLGRFYDVYGGRICISYSLLALSASLLALAAAHSDSQVFLALVGLRTIGLGALDTYTSNTVSVWFVRRRGVALACMTVGWALVRSLRSCRQFRSSDSPAGALGQGGFWFCVGLLSRVSRTSLGWRGALRVAAALCAASAPLTALLLRRSPERVGLLPDCDDAPAEPKAGEPAAAPPPAEAPSATRAEALATPLFAVWAVYTLLFFFAASGSDFHL